MTITANVTIRRPRMEDGANIWRLVKQSGVLDVNSSYCYLMMCKMFPDTCAVAEMDGRLVGFVIAFRPPVEPDSLFIWQIGVDPALRGNGLGKALIQTLLERPTSETIRYITATISPSNLASQKLLTSLARHFSSNLQSSAAEGMDERLFPEGNHDAEHFYRIGPLKNRTITPRPIM
jgi:L-2,4-diaminobutyric acid acetyltransferase